MKKKLQTPELCQYIFNKTRKIFFKPCLSNYKSGKINFQI